MRLILITIVAVSGSVCAGDAIDPECVELCRNLVAPVWTDSARRFGGFEVQYEYANFDVPGKGIKNLRLKRTRKYVVSPGGQLRLVETGTQEAPVVFASNERYGFQVRGSTDGESSSLHEIADTPLVSANPNEQRLHTLMMTDSFARFGFEFFGVPYAEIFAEGSSCFDLKEARYLDSDGESRVRISGVYNGEEGVNRFVGCVYWAEFSAKTPFRVHRSGIEAVPPYSEELFTIEYSDENSEFPYLPRSIERVSGSADLGSFQSVSFALPRAYSAKESDFYLPRFGISEAVLPASVPPVQRWSAGYLVVGLLLVVSSLLWWRFGKAGGAKAASR